ncbi:MAG TPA: FAD-dependent oxidoreductase [Terracidiphilus sp.]|nr:FAD-dependent oxidoreductase [Terracidiphilus sp.]
MAPTSERPIRVAVVGGGCAALTAAFELTKPEHQGRYEVTVYQMGWRLGGKGASGRGVADRVEEHGLHLWMGFYENAFRLMRECYAERNLAFPNCRFADWRDAFKPAPDIGVADHSPDGWAFWMAHFPPGQGEPGDPISGGPFTVAGYLRQAVALVVELLRSAGAMEQVARASGTVAAAAASPAAPEALATAISALLRYGQLATTAAILEAGDLLRTAAEQFFPQFFTTVGSPVAQLLEVLSVTARRQLEILVEGDRELRRVWQVIDLVLAVLRGSIRCGLALDPRGFDAINDYDWREWLRMNGASAQALDSGFMRGIYDLVFAYEDGDIYRPRLAAGVALRGALRMFFTYRGALFWRMGAGMGDVVFAPLYQALKHRGVRFNFFHRLRNIGLAPEKEGEAAFVDTLEFDVQARITGGKEYQPLLDVHNLPSWPSQPDYAQLVEGSKLKREGRAFEAAWDKRRAGVRTLRVMKDFDLVVLGVSIGALPEVASELIARAVRWRDMVRHIKTVPTQSFQVWMSESPAELGWPHPPANLSGFMEPFDTWADMSHLVPEESWKEPVRSIAYFCGVLPDATKDGAEITASFHREQKDAVRANAIRFLNMGAGELWPGAVRDGEFRWEMLAAEGEKKSQRGPRRFDAQYWAANLNPTDRYVQSLPGSLAYRISPLDMTFDNLTIAGDWTASGLDSGCIESAVMSGLLAAHAISGEPALAEIVGYNHP